MTPLRTAARRPEQALRRLSIGCQHCTFQISVNLGRYSPQCHADAIGRVHVVRQIIDLENATDSAFLGPETHWIGDELRSDTLILIIGFASVALGVLLLLVATSA